jgi:hypothetical protein
VDEPPWQRYKPCAAACAARWRKSGAGAGAKACGRAKNVSDMDLRP